LGEGERGREGERKRGEEARAKKRRAESPRGKGMEEEDHRI